MVRKLAPLPLSLPCHYFVHHHNNNQQNTNSMILQKNTRVGTYSRPHRQRRGSFSPHRQRLAIKEGEKYGGDGRETVAEIF